MRSYIESDRKFNFCYRTHSHPTEKKLRKKPAKSWSEAIFHLGWVHRYPNLWKNLKFKLGKRKLVLCVFFFICDLLLWSLLVDHYRLSSISLRRTCKWILNLQQLLDATLD